MAYAGEYYLTDDLFLICAGHIVANIRNALGPQKRDRTAWSWKECFPDLRKEQQEQSAPDPDQLWNRICNWGKAWNMATEAKKSG
jgi:hypothetical protein